MVFTMALTSLDYEAAVDCTTIIACHLFLSQEFIAAMLDSSRVARRKDAVRQSFEELDRDGDGFITAEDLVKVMMPRGASIELAREMVNEVDSQGRVDYNEVSSPSFLFLPRRMSVKDESLKFPVQKVCEGCHTGKVCDPTRRVPCHRERSCGHICPNPVKRL